jgi:hypothetical protein
MAILVMDGFDLYTNTAGTNMLTKWSSNTGVTMSSTTPYGVGQSIAISTTTDLGPVLTFTPTSTVTAGFAFRTNNINPWNLVAGTTNVCLMHFLSGTTYQVGLQYNADGSLQANRMTTFNAGTSLGFTSAGVIKVNTWHYIEVAVTISDSVGTFRVDVDGTTVLNLTGVDTRNGTPTTVSSIDFT